MAIGTTAAILGGATLLGGIGGALIGADAQSDAASQANASQQAAVAAQLQLGQQSLALQQQLAAQSMGLSTDIYNTNYDLLSPWVARGNVAGDAYSALLGLPAAPTMTSPLANPAGGTYTSGGGMPLGGGTPGGAPGIPGISAPPYTQAQIDAMWHDGIDGNAELAQQQLNAWNAAHPPAAPAPAPTPAPAPAATTMAAPAPTPAATATLLASPASSPAPTAALAPAPAPTSAPPSTGAGTYGAGTHAAGGPDGLTNDLALSGYGPGTMQSTNAQSHPGGLATLDPAQGGGAPIGGWGGGTVGGIISGMPNISLPPAVTPPAAPPSTTTPPPATTPPASGTATDPYDAFQNFANSAGMQFQLEQGTDAINNLYAGAGALQSGAAMKAISDYGQRTALNNYFMPYMNMLGGVSNTGAQAGSAVAGVGSQFSNTAAGINSGFGNAATGINGAMGGAIGNGANAASNAAIAQGAATAGMWGNIGSSIGSAAGMLMPYPGY